MIYCFNLFAVIKLLNSPLSKVEPHLHSRIACSTLFFFSSTLLYPSCIYIETIFIYVRIRHAHIQSQTKSNVYKKEKKKKSGSESPIKLKSYKSSHLIFVYAAAADGCVLILYILRVYIHNILIYKYICELEYVISLENQNNSTDTKTQKIFQLQSETNTKKNMVVIFKTLFQSPSQHTHTW